MTDTLAERFAALADPHDDSDWVDVRRRVRRRRARLVTPAAAVLAAAAAAAAVAASGGWLFETHGRQVIATTHVTLGGRSWLVTLDQQPRSHDSVLCVHATTGSTTAQPGCDIGLLSPPLRAVRADVPGGGQIWAGTTLGFTRRVTIVDAAGRSHSAATVAAPRGTKTPSRYWAIAIDRTIGMTLIAHDANGRSLRWNLR